MRRVRHKFQGAYHARRAAILAWERCFARLVAGEVWLAGELQRLTAVVGHIDRNFMALARKR